jgi:hypothetical protein
MKPSPVFISAPALTVRCRHILLLFPPAARPVSARSPGKSQRGKPTTNTPATAKRKSRKPAGAAASISHQQQAQRQGWLSDAADTAPAASYDEFSFWTRQDAAAAGIGKAPPNAAAAAGSSNSPSRSALLAAARQRLSGRVRAVASATAPGAWPGMSAQEVQVVQLAAQQQLQEQQQREEDDRWGIRALSTSNIRSADCS